VELMETWLTTPQLGRVATIKKIASFIGSGINGNSHSRLNSYLDRLNIASFIGSGINGNF
jgi:plasmid replication initiation protein